MFSKNNIFGKLIMVVLCLIFVSHYAAADGTLTIQDCDGCSLLSPGYLYDCLGPESPTKEYEMWADNWECDIEVNPYWTTGDIDSTWNDLQDGEALNGCDGYSDSTTLSYTTARSQEYDISASANWEIIEGLGVSLGFSTTVTSSSGTGTSKTVTCPACKSGEVRPEEYRRHLNVTITMIATQKYDINKWEMGYVWVPVYPSGYYMWTQVDLIETTPTTEDCGTDDMSLTNVGYRYFMSFPNTFTTCPGEGGCPCVPL